MHTGYMHTGQTGEKIVFARSAPNHTISRETKTLHKVLGTFDKGSQPQQKKW